MSLEYVILSTDEAYAKGLITYNRPWKPGNVIFRVEDGNYLELGNDVGEPEDKNFLRDFGWVLSELKYAHSYGKPADPAPPTSERQLEIRKQASDLFQKYSQAQEPASRAFCKQALANLQSFVCAHPGRMPGAPECPDCHKVW
jgi:hypothetical protein